MNEAMNEEKNEEQNEDNPEKGHDLFKIFTINIKALRKTVSPLMAIALQLRVQGIENVPQSGGAILACREESLLDAILQAMYFPRPVTHLAGTELFTLNLSLKEYYNSMGLFLGVPLLWRMSTVPANLIATMIGAGLRTQFLEWEIRPKTDRPETKIRELLDENRVLGLYPSSVQFSVGKETATENENASENTDPYARTIADLAMQNNVPVIPAMLMGDIRPPDFSGAINSWKLPWDAEYRIGPSIKPEEFKGASGDREQDFSSAIHTALANLHRSS